MQDGELKIREKKTADAVDESTKNETFFAPLVDIYETDSEVTVIADIPGISTEGVDISLEDNVLTIQGQRKSPPPSGRPLLEEYENGHYLRRFTVSEAIDQEHIEAFLADGVLRIRLPKAAPAQLRKIEVKMG